MESRQLQMFAAASIFDDVDRCLPIRRDLGKLKVEASRLQQENQQLRTQLNRSPGSALVGNDHLTTQETLSPFKISPFRPVPENENSQKRKADNSDEGEFRARDFRRELNRQLAMPAPHINMPPPHIDTPPHISMPPPPRPRQPQAVNNQHDMADHCENNGGNSSQDNYGAQNYGGDFERYSHSRQSDRRFSPEIQQTAYQVPPQTPRPPFLSRPDIISRPLDTMMQFQTPIRNTLEVSLEAADVDSLAYVGFLDGSKLSLPLR